MSDSENIDIEVKQEKIKKPVSEKQRLASQKNALKAREARLEKAKLKKETHTVLKEKYDLNSSDSESDLTSDSDSEYEINFNSKTLDYIKKEKPKKQEPKEDNEMKELLKLLLAQQVKQGNKQGRKKERKVFVSAPSPIPEKNIISEQLQRRILNF